MKGMMRKPELLLPAGSLDLLKVAFRYGADAVYAGGEEYSLRAKAQNFTLTELDAGVRFAHEIGKKVYVTANIFAHNEDLSGAARYFEELREIGPDALLISDPGLFLLAKEHCPQIPIHISTQANNTNYETCRFWEKLGATRIVTARELSFAELRELRAHTDLELETFIHGAMCISYSGRCLLSSYFTGKDSNRGECTHPCRWSYTIEEETRSGEHIPVVENERGTYLFNSRDLCMIDAVPELVRTGVDSFKVEGRMKNALYVATVARAYRNAIDDVFISPERYQANLPRYLEELSLCTHRPYGTGFFYGKPDASGQIYEKSAYEHGATYLGVVEAVSADGAARLTQKNKFSVGETIEALKPDGTDRELTVVSIRDTDGAEMQSAPHAKQQLFVKLDGPVEQGDVLRRREESERSRS